MEILAVFQAKISVSDELCISGDTATIALPEYAIQPHYRHSAAGDECLVNPFKYQNLSDRWIL